MKKARCLRVVTLGVAEVDDMLASLKDACTVKGLSGQQRQQLEDAHRELGRARKTGTGDTVMVPVEALMLVLRCVSMTQQWVRDMFTEYAVEKHD